MRKTLRTISYVLGGLSLFQISVGIIDWLGRWGWLKTFMALHPAIAWFFHTPLLYLAILIGIGLSVWIQGILRQPNLIGRYTNFRAVPDLHSATMQVLFDSQQEKPGWDLERFDWEFFFEIQIVNDSDYATTFDGLRSEISTGRLWRKRIFESQGFDDLNSFDMDMCLNNTGQGNGQRLIGDRYRPLPSLVDKIKDVPLERGIGHKGWLHFHVSKVNQREINSGKIRVDLWIIDAYQNRHEVSFRKKDSKSWDSNFFVGRKVNTRR